MMKILVINPPRVSGFPVVREERFEHKDIGSVYPPLSLLHTAALLEEEGYQVKLIDANGFDLKLADIQKGLKEYQPEVVMIRAGFDTQKEDLKVLKIAKEISNPTTIVRNHIISRTPRLRKKLLQENDFVDVFLNQEPESMVIPLMKTLEKKGDFKEVPGISFKRGGKVINNQDTKLIADLDRLPFPAYHLLPSLDVYYSGSFGPPFVTVLGSRGCPFNCAFCAYNKTSYRTRGAESIADELEWLVKKYKIKDFCFLDDVVTFDSERMIKISKAIIKKKLNLRWAAGIRATNVSFKMLKYMKEAGCDEIAVGIESGSEKILKKVDKRISLDDVRKAAARCHQLKIKFYAMFIIGLPGETEETVKASINLAKELKPFYTQFCFATPFPNTRIYQYYKKHGFLLTEDWSQYFSLSDKPVVRTEVLSKRDLINLRNEAYKEVLLNPKYLLSQVSLTDWRWNWRGLKELGKRMVATHRNKPVR
ncbi:MAG: B12-binding domain-containing radical SAM protein [Candidatus Marinimicrobia bacterium]|nr:B12-binding domain-containing radical SAM protein [Candidatus Neomarinimicrobiota bacterium]